jgi:hypothetical protein
MVADIEIRSELRGRDQELAADVGVAEADRDDDDSGRQREDRCPRDAGPDGDGSEAQCEPAQDDRVENARVLAVERKQAKDGAGAEEPPRAGPVQELAEQGEEQRDKEEVE